MRVITPADNLDLKYVVAGLTDLCCFSAAVESEHPDDSNLLWLGSPSRLQSLTRGFCIENLLVTALVAGRLLCSPVACVDDADLSTSVYRPSSRET